ncbi:MAG TPA: right-handed parallel beta-helix repeat-containing protein [Bryobacteraceae bacterium]
MSLGLAHSAAAATLCVNPGGTSGCYTTIGAAISAAAANDTINVGPGQYTEDVVVTKALTLVGSGANATVINAKGLANGIYVNGLDNGGLSGVTITGFTVLNANYEGILLTNTSYSLIANNHVVNNDQSLNFAAGTCAGLPVFETNEGEDCGEGIHLVGVHHTTVSNNDVDLNSGGILLSDETGMTYANEITGNSVHDNAFDCGITLASHAPAPQASSTKPFGVFNNNMIGNHVSSNGLAGEGAGIGIFAPGPGNLAFGNHIIGNIIQNNGLPGVTMHNHAAPPGAPGIDMNDTVIQGNFISGNGADVQDSATPGTTGINIYSVAPVYAMSILENTIQNEAVDVVMNNPGAMELHLNNLLGKGIGVANLGKGVVNGTLNFFGCAGGPGNTGCSTVKGAASTIPALAAPVSSAPLGPRGR